MRDPTLRTKSLLLLGAVDLSAVKKSRDEESHGSLDSMAGGVFVGRHREMDQLKGVFEEVLSGRGRMLTLVGEPGIGKTRTAQELATYAGMRGATVSSGAGATSQEEHLLTGRGCRRSGVTSQRRSLNELRDQMGAPRSVIAEIVPDVK